jgi:hypothetical protein
LPPADVPAGQARAFTVTGDDHGFTGIWAHCKDGDIRLVNEVIDVCVSGLKSNRFELFTGGAIVDARMVGDTGEEIFDLMKARAQFNVHRAETVEVVRDGTDGGPAVIRVTGPDTPIAYFVGAVGPTVLRSQDLTMTTEYRLFPGDGQVEVYTEALNESSGPRTFPMGDWIAFGDGAAVFRPNAGLDIEANAEFAWSAGFGDGRAFGVVQSDVLISETLPLGSIPWVITNSGQESLPLGETRQLFRWFVVRDGDAEAIRRAAGELGAIELPDTEQTVRLQDEAGNPIAGQVVEILSGDNAVTAVVTGEDGTATFMGDPGVFRVRTATVPGAPPFDDTVAFAGEGTVTVPQSGTVRVSVDTSAGGSSSGTSRVTLYGPGRLDGVVQQGEGTFEVAPGSWRLVVQRGPEWSVDARDITVVAGETIEIDATLTPVMNTDGWISADFHQHMEPSIDSEITLVDRVLDNVAHGVEFVAPTDHEVVTDLQPYIDKLGLTDELGTFPGVEISPTIAHIGLYPLTYQPDERGRGSIPLAVLEEDGDTVQRRIPDIIEIARTLPSDPIVQINHARDNSGMFINSDFDPEQDPADFEGSLFTTDFDVMELVNRKSQVCQLFADFSGFWNSGYTPTGLGNSDSHGKWGGVGQPRSWLHIDKPIRDIGADDIRTAMLEHRVTVGANAFVDFADGMLPGDTIVGASGQPVDFHVRVQTPTYAQASVLVAIANGRVIDRRMITSASATLDFDEVVSYSFTEDTWVTFFVWGPAPQGDVSYGFPVMAFTNPVRVDVDGDADNDGEPWEAPGPRPLELGDLDNNYCSF